MRSKRRKEPAQGLASSSPRLRTQVFVGRGLAPAAKPCPLFATASYNLLVGATIGRPKNNVPSLPRLRTLTRRAGACSRRKAVYHLRLGIAQSHCRGDHRSPESLAPSSPPPPRVSSLSGAEGRAAITTICSFFRLAARACGCAAKGKAAFTSKIPPSRLEYG